MLKATGKGINIRTSSLKASRVPIIVLGNTPIRKSYYPRVDFLKLAGVIQGFWSINPQPLEPQDDKVNIKKTPGSGYYRIDNYQELWAMLDDLLGGEREFFSSMRTKDELGRFIEIANKEATFEKKAEKFLSLIRG